MKRFIKVHLRTKSAIITTLLFLFSMTLFGQSLYEFSDLDSFEKILKGKIHFSIDSDGSIVAIGDYHQPTTRLNKTIPQVGSVLIYSKDEHGNWNFIQEIKSPRGKAFDNFGVSVALSDKYLVIGALGEDHINSEGELVHDTGAAYFYKKNEDGEFILAQKICSSDLHPYSIFGSKVDIKKDEIIIDSHTEENNNTNWVAHTFKQLNGEEWIPTKKVATDGHIKTQDLRNILSVN